MTTINKGEGEGINKSDRVQHETQMRTSFFPWAPPKKINKKPPGQENTTFQEAQEEPKIKYQTKNRRNDYQHPSPHPPHHDVQHQSARKGWSDEQKCTWVYLAIDTEEVPSGSQQKTSHGLRKKIRQCNQNKNTDRRFVAAFLPGNHRWCWSRDNRWFFLFFVCVFFSLRLLVFE